MNCRQFDIWLADLSPRFGTESGKTRPVLVVQTSALNEVHPSTIVCPITSNVSKKVTLLRVNIKKNLAGLKKDSGIMIDQIRTIDNRRLIKRIGTLPKTHQRKVAENLKIILNLDVS